MRLALISGDGLPVSGLLTVFRNVVALARQQHELTLPVPADLGFSWRPDKPAFYPEGIDPAGHPDWLDVTTARPVADSARLAKELTWIRDRVAIGETLSPDESRELDARIELLAGPYEEHFTRLLTDHRVDWVVAVNMTLSDAVPVTLALHRAAARYWAAGRPGGILFWDHDLFGSYAVHEGTTRVYPVRPNAFTPLPGGHPSHRWAVVSPGLATEADGYPTALRPTTVPNVLPVVRPEPTDRHREFLARFGIGPERPVVLCPVRVFRVKGVELSVELLAAVRAETRRRGEPDPVLLVFGSLGEDPEYAAEVLAAVDEFDVAADVRFLDGVPLASHRDRHGRWHLDEADLLALCAASHGGVFFTPNRPDVESVGLGPALAALVRVPCASTGYGVLDEVYGPGFRQVRVLPGAYPEAGAAFADWIARTRDGDRDTLDALTRNQEIVAERFPDLPWTTLLSQLAAALHPEV
ncbi:hypothetical protein OHV05_33990 [Kitasatospora sp. NBC_00070]|uniref:hypothetical protein n=1 Tax=Kitasatospora sp. NBC_00070 TaxID=2975962 RepID=UPI0032550354